MSWILGAIIVQYVLFEWNMIVYRPFKLSDLGFWPRVSVLVPCRNEAPRIESCVRTLLSQDYPDFEVVVYDDDSDDGSYEILQTIAQEDKRLVPIRGGTLEIGWTGKNRACHKLSQSATGEWMLFVDADTTHDPAMLKHAIATVVREKASFLSTFPRQIFRSADACVVPLMFFILLTFLPMFWVERKTWKAMGDFSAACGQFLLFRKSAYVKAGGHAAVRNRISEGPALASAIKRAGDKILLRDGSRWTACSMYTSLGEAMTGFTRSAFATMNGSSLTAGFFFIYQTAVYVVPPFVLVGCLVTGSGPLALSVAATLLPIWIRFRIHARISMPLRWIWAHAASMALYNCVILNSFFRFKIAKNAVWKNRAYAPGESG